MTPAGDRGRQARDPRSAARARAGRVPAHHQRRRSLNEQAGRPRGRRLPGQPRACGRRGGRSARPTVTSSTRPRRRSAARPTTSRSTAGCCSGWSAPGARGDRGRRRQRLRAGRPPGQRALQGQARRHEAAPRRGVRGAARLRALVDAAGAARPERGRGRPGKPGAGWRTRLSRPRARGRHRLRALPADRRPAGAAAADHAGGARRAAVHHRPPGLRAVVQADAPRARAGRGGAARPGRPHAAVPWLKRDRGDRPPLPRPARRARDHGPRGLPRVPRSARARLGLPVAPVPRHRGGLPGALAGFCAGAGLPLGEEHRRGADRRARRPLPRPRGRPAAGARHQVCELLVDHDETVQRWRFHHTLMAAREIGSRPARAARAGSSTCARRSTGAS